MTGRVTTCALKTARPTASALTGECGNMVWSKSHEVSWGDFATFARGHLGKNSMKPMPVAVSRIAVG